MLCPVGKDYLWGGSRLNDDFKKNIDLSPLAETWECSTHPDGLSSVASGEYAGLTLKEVLKLHPEYLGSHPVCTGSGDLPILIKLIDANKDLSIQVHPSDEYARANENGQSGKTEMWYVLDAAGDARLVYGFKKDVSKQDVRDAIQSGTLQKLVRSIAVRPDDLFYVEPGTVHAIGRGVLIAEIQQSSNLTYRLYDYDRIDKNGRKRELHIDKALETASLNKSAEPRQPLRVINYKPGVATELLCRCRYFEVNRLLVNTERRQKVIYGADELSFRVLLCVKGCGTVTFGEDDAECRSLNLYKGDCLFVPADSEKIVLHGQMQCLDVRC